KRLSIAAQPLGVFRITQLRELFDVRAGDERVRLSTDQHRALHRIVAVDAIEQLDECLAHAARDLVHRLANQIYRQNRDAVFDLHGHRRLVPRIGYWSSHARLRHTSRSSTIAKPRPPAAQTVIRPYCASRRPISFNSVVVMRAPVAPKGCPSAIDPPITFNRARSTSPTGSANPAR